MPTLEDIRTGIAEVWGRVLRLDAVPENANFFEIGGSSLAAVHIASLLQERYQVTIDVIDVFENDDLNALADVLHERLRSEGDG